LVILLIVGSAGMPIAAPADAAAQSAAQVYQGLAAKAADGGYNAAEATDALRAAGMSTGEINAAITKLQAIDRQAKANEKDANKDQNTSGTGTWLMGTVYPGVKYSVTYPLTNACRVGQSVAITYPGNIPLTGPPTVGVPAHSTVDVDMKLEFPPLPPAPPTFGPVNLTCTPLSAVLASVHHQTQSTRKTPAGTYIYTCHESDRVYKISVCLFNGPPPEQGGGGKPKKLGPQPKPQPDASHPTCVDLWNANKTISLEEARTVEHCTSYIRERAHELFDELLKPYRDANPAKWAWLPAGHAIDALSIQQILTLKAQAFADLAKN
jgi:hypothetical protein